MSAFAVDLSKLDYLTQAQREDPKIRLLADPVWWPYRCIELNGPAIDADWIVEFILEPVFLRKKLVYKTAYSSGGTGEVGLAIAVLHSLVAEVVKGMDNMRRRRRPDRSLIEKLVTRYGSVRELASHFGYDPSYMASILRHYKIQPEWMVRA